MSIDYLGRLAARALGTAPVLHPRATTPWESTFETATRIETDAIPSLAAASLPQRVAAPGAPRGPLPRMRSSSAPLAEQSAPVEVASSRASEIIATPFESIATDVAIAPPSERPPEGQASVRSTPPNDRPNDRPSEPPSDRRSDQPPTFVIRERRLVERIERLRVRETSRAARTETAPPPAPVEITIGRIDVRAVSSTASAPPPRPRPHAPMLSLRDYLAQRDERRRR